MAAGSSDLTQGSNPSEETLPRRFGKYTLLRRMATGGMAEIFLALQRSVAGFEKLIVIKRILPAMNQDRGFIDMLLHEARVAASLSHPNIVQTIDVGQVDGTYFIALEHVHGEDLRSIVRQMRKKGVVEFPLEHAVAIILGMCAGLAYAHEKRDLDGTELNIVHRDVSPQNVLVGFAGDVKIVDFGVAKSGTQTAEQTKGGQLKGKVPYMAPEQARGEEVDFRADVFAIGVMLFELTTGKRLFKGATEFETLKMIVEKDYPKPSWVVANYPPALEAIVTRALEKDRDVRYQTAREMQAELEAFVRDEKMPVSSIALAEFMKGLFEEKLAAQKESLMQGRQLADVIANEASLSDRGEGSSAESGRFTTTGVTSTGVAGSVGGSVPPPKSSAKWALVAVPVALVAAASVFFLVRKQNQPAVVTSKTETPSVESAKPSKGKLEIKSEPTGAHIWINGEVRAETTPATLADLPVGATVDIKVGLEGYATKVEKVTLADTSAVTRNFTLVKGVLKVELTTVPVGSTATLDGKPLAALTFDTSPGEPHTLVVSAPGHVAKTIKIQGEVNDTKKLEVVLDRKSDAVALAPKPDKIEKPAEKAATGGPGKLIVSASGGWCNVTVDGKNLGATPTGAVELSAGTHSVTCTDATGKMLAQGTKVTPGETSRVRFAIP